ncbi:MAG: hypothetical protein KF819_38000 [Labilithrix sp.]|nr:hypothetical protein [Labilithrix sp.]
MRRLSFLLSLALALAGCDALGSIVVEAGDFAGAKADVHCDRRVVEGGGRPAAFCQEVIATVAAAEFSDDCRAKHKATAAPGPCPRPSIIAGCKLNKANKDDSSVFDWYYEVDREIDSRARDVEDVSKMCADPSRYEEGAELAQP